MRLSGAWFADVRLSGVRLSAGAAAAAGLLLAGCGSAGGTQSSPPPPPASPFATGTGTGSGFASGSTSASASASASASGSASASATGSPVGSASGTGSTAASPSATTVSPGANSAPNVINGPDIHQRPQIEAGRGTPPNQLVIVPLVEGSGQTAGPHSTVTVNYVGVNYVNGTVFDSSYGSGQPATFSLDEVIPGLAQGISGMKVGGRREIVIPPSLGYGNQASGPIVANETLVFVVDLLSVQS